VGIDPVSAYYETPPSRAGLLLGYAALEERDIRAGVKRLAGLLPAGRARRRRRPTG